MKSCLFAFVVLFLIIKTEAQIIPGEKMVPQSVKTKFSTDFPNAKIKRWNVKTIEKEYTAVFVDQNLNKRMRYKGDATPIILFIHYKGNEIPAAYTAKVSAEFQGYKIDWANEWKNFANGNNFIEVRLSKPGYIVKVIVDTNGNPVTDEKKIKDDMKKVSESEQENTNE